MRSDSDRNMSEKEILGRSLKYWQYRTENRPDVPKCLPMTKAHTMGDEKQITREVGCNDMLSAGTLRTLQRY